jgi:diguanylate cyclase (GGDEF)-like protein/PAS domain S-box-containing protein
LAHDSAINGEKDQLSEIAIKHRQTAYGLALLEVVLQVLAAASVYQHLAGRGHDPTAGHLWLAVFGSAIALRAFGALMSTGRSALTGDYGRSAGAFAILTAMVLGLCWGATLPVLSYLGLVSEIPVNALPIAAAVAALAVFAGSSFNSRLLLSFVLPAFFPTLAWLVIGGHPGQLPVWGLLTLALLALTHAGGGLEELIERFLQISRGNADLMKNLAVARDEAVAAQRAAEQARETIQDEISERVKAEQKIVASERELARILDDMMDTYFQVGPDGSLQRISPSVQWMLGYSVAECRGRQWSDLFSDPAGYASFMQAIEHGFGTLENHEVRLRHREGHDVWVTINAHYREDEQGKQQGFEGIARDTTESRKSKEDLFQEKEQWRVTLESIADGVITTDIDGRVHYLNPVAEKMTGWNNRFAQDKPLTEVMTLVDEQDAEPVILPTQDWLEHGRKAALAEPAVLIHREDESESSIELSGSPIRDSANGIIGSVMVLHDVTTLRALARQLSFQATHDALTGLINRIEFDARLDQAIHSANGQEKQHVLMYIDLDQFKVVNDTCGHPAGDELLKQVTRLLRGTLRESDVLARLGGDEFGVLLLGCPLEKAEEIAEKLRKNVEDFRFRYEGNEFRIGASIGAVPIVNSDTAMTDLMKSVDAACYVAKEQGRNRVHVSCPDDEQVAQQHGQMQWMQRIQRAVEQNEFVLHAQAIEPIGQPVPGEKRAELLLRMIEERGNGEQRIIPPAAFLPAAERYHLMPLIDRWVLKKALQMLAGENPAMQQLTSCSINLSGQSLNDLKLHDYILGLLDETGVDPRRLCFEITESAVIANMEIAREFVNSLRKRGVTFALDDFGSGLSTFDYLKKLNVDYVKLDGSLVRDITTSRVSQAMVHAINYVAHVMGMKTIAEFVESDNIMRALQKLSVDFAQGYAIGKPQPLAE